MLTPTQRLLRLGWQAAPLLACALWLSSCSSSSPDEASPQTVTSDTAGSLATTSSNASASETTAASSSSGMTTTTSASVTTTTATTGMSSWGAGGATTGFATSMGGTSVDASTSTSVGIGGDAGTSTSVGMGGAGGASSTTNPAVTTGADSGGSGGTGGDTGFTPCPGPGSPCLILPFGDSITDGVGVDGGGGYRIELFRMALADDHDISFVGSLVNGPMNVDGVPFPRDHEGHSGWRIAELNPLIPSPAFSTLPHIVLLMIGTNDMIQNDNPAQAPDRLGTLLDAIVTTAPDALVVVAKLTPLTFNTNLVQAYNDAVPSVVEARIAQGKHLVLVDQHTGFPTSELVDGVHPGVEGYARMAGVWYEAIEPYLR